MEYQIYFAAIIILFFASVLQSAIGFAFALFATPLLTYTGIPLPAIVTLVSSCSFLQSLVGIVKLRKETPWKTALVATVFRGLSVVFGIYFLKQALNLNQPYLRMMIGILLVVLVLLQIFFRPQPQEKLPWFWGLLAFFGSGFLSGLCGMGGPPLVLWVMAHSWSNNKSRAFLFATFTAALPIQLILMTLNFGQEIWHYFLLALCLTPVIYLGSIIGLALGAKLNKQQLKNCVYALLLFIGFSAIIPVLLKKLPSGG